MKFKQILNDGANGKKNCKVIVVMPAYNAEQTLEQTFKDIPAGSVDEVILVDDCSKDHTVEIAKRLGITVIQHKVNKGYGGNQKTCYDEALRKDADIVVMLHPDYQYDSRLIAFFSGYLQEGICDIMLGCRIRARAEALASGMPVYKYFSNRFLTIIENIVLGQNLGDFHSGFRVYTREALETIPYHKNSDDFVFDSEFLAQAAYFGFRIGDAPMPTRYFDEASSINFKRSFIYGLSTLAVLVKYCLHRWKIKRFDIFIPNSKPVKQIQRRQTLVEADS